MTEGDMLYFNGVDAATGQYALPPMSAKQFSDGILGTLPDDETQALNSWFSQRGVGHYGIVEGNDPKDLAQSGWGIVFPANTNPAIVDALKPLMEWRKQQAGERYKEYMGGQTGVRPKDTKGSWLARLGVQNFGPVDPTAIPYYLMLVGDPTEIDYRFQYLLDVQYAVGRIAFDTPEEYAYYAQSVVAAEKKQLKLARKISFFGVANPDDAATNLSANNLILPLCDWLSQEKLGDQKPWMIDTILKDDATKQRLASYLGGPETPAILFTASHGMSFPNGDPKQLRHQGSLLCQNWPGPNKWKAPISEDLYFSADDLASDANLWGTIAFLFACYGAGTPQYDEFAKQAFKDQRAQIAPNAFLARLPRKMLAHPKGGALAVIGHVERAWGYSFVWGKGRSLTAFEATMKALMTGAPIGYAFEYFNERYAEFSTELTQTLDDANWSPVDPNELAGKWTANNDSKNYVVLGDPAVRALVAPETPQSAAVVDRPSINLASVPASAAANFAAEAAGAEAAGAEAASAVAVAPALAPAEATKTAMVVADIAPAAVEPTAAVNYGLFDGGGNMGSSIQQFAQKLGDFLAKAIDAAATLEVSTYTSTNMDQVVVDGSTVTGAQRRAVTAIRIDGDTRQVIPLDENGDVDMTLWNLHLEMVKQAQESRNELIKAAVSAVSSLMNVGGLK